MPPREWKPSPKDATSFAAFRWFANAIENESLELYATSRETYEHIEAVLRQPRGGPGLNRGNTETLNRRLAS